METLVELGVKKDLIKIKWPNDLITESGIKLGGVLVESSTSESAVRVGVGINRESAVVEGTEVSGWSQQSPEMELMEVFTLVDTTLASLFESRPYIPAVTKLELAEVSWKGLANSLSRGVFIESEGGISRVIGLDGGGRLEIETMGEVGISDDVESVDWIILSD